MEAPSRLFISAAIPMKILPPLFKLSRASASIFGAHVDGTIRAVPGTPAPVRTGLSVTPYLGGAGGIRRGELPVEDKYGVHEVKLPTLATRWFIPQPACITSNPSPAVRGLPLFSGCQA